MSDCNSNIVTWHNVCDPYNYEATFSSASATIYLNGLCVYEGVIVEGNTYPIINLNIGVNEVRIVYGSSCVIFYIETYYEVGEEIAFNSSTLLLQEEEVCDPCGTNVPSIPFATLLLNGDEFLEVFINTITDIILIYENGTEVVPLSVVDNVITLSNPGEGGDATYDLEDENGNTISSGSIVCGTNEVIVAPNALINIRDSATLIMYALDLLSNSASNQVIVDSVATLKDTANNTLSTTNIVAQGTANITAPDGTITYNGGTALTTVRSNQTKDLTLVYANGDSATPTTQLGTVLTFPNPQASYDPRDKVDFFTLNWTNPFGNNNRFTDIVGTQVYAVAAVIDWTTYKISAGTVLVISSNLTLVPAGTYAAAVTAYSTLNLGGLIGFTPIDFIYLVDLFNPPNGYAYVPFSYPNNNAWGAPQAIRSNTTYVTGTSKMGIQLGALYQQLPNAGAYRTMASRLTTLSELGL